MKKHEERPSSLVRSLVALALALALAGCTLLERPPALVVKNDTAAEVAGEARLYPAGNVTEGALEARWGFHVPALAFREIARLPRAQGDHRLVVELEDGREGGGRALSGTHHGTLLVRITDGGVIVEPQSTR